ncbi:hypothetical protein ABRP92_11855 [Pectobacterium aroidearum]|uniref:hypothetical protein n=1 Tax=Pectobacterium aroidearum TaxID=1201031 RepID=UPI0032EB771B
MASFLPATLRAVVSDVFLWLFVKPVTSFASHLASHFPVGRYPVIFVAIEQKLPYRSVIRFYLDVKILYVKILIIRQQ